MSHHWPWLTPWSVWGLDLDEWRLFARTADQIIAIRNRRGR